VGLKIIETLGDEDEDMEEIMTDMSIKEEDQEIDIEAFASGAAPEAPAKEKEEEAGEDDGLPVDVDKVYAEDA
jgi:small subunit ribosomal protein S2